MKILLIFLLVGVLTIVSACTPSDSRVEKGAAVDLAKGLSASDATEYYTCPMHPSVRSDKPGACPVCGMALVKKTAVKEASTVEMASLQTVTLSPVQRVLANVSTVPAVRGEFSKEITAVGVIGFAEPLQAKVAARFGGRIEKLHVSYTGEMVRKGQALFDLHSPDLVSAEQELILAVQSAGNAVSPGGTAPSNQDRLVQAARERLHVHFGMTSEQVAEVEHSKQAHSTLTFYSPIRGTVIDKNVQEGQYVDEGMLLYQLADLSTVWVSLDIYEKDARFVKVGQQVNVTAEAYPNEELTGKVTFVSPVVDPDTRTVRVRTELPNRDGRLRPQMYIRASVEVPRSKAVTIPASAVLATGRRNVVWVEVKQNQFEPRDVTLGASDDGRVEVLSGIHEGELVAETGGFLIDSESALLQPADANPHAGHNMADMKAQAGRGNQSAPPESRHTIVKIIVDGQYIPDVVHVPRDMPIRLEFIRKDTGSCSSEVFFASLNLRRELPEGKATTIELPPQKPGEIHFACGMGMLHGTIVVD